MKTTHDFIAERALANHCPELLAKAQTPENRAKAVADFAAGLCRALPDRLQPLLIGKKPVATAAKAETQTAASLMREIGNEAANYSISAGDSSDVLLVSIDLETAVCLTDRLFGGSGQRQADAATSLPLSAGMALERIAASCAAAFAAASGAERSTVPISHNNDIARLQPFPRSQYCVCWTVTIEQEGLGSWTMRIAMLESDLHALLDGQSGHKSDAAAIPAETQARSGAFSSIPLTLHAVLAELQIPLGKLSALRPDDIIPFAPPREIPLRIGAQNLALGCIGTLDERVALRLTKIH